MQLIKRHGPRLEENWKNGEKGTNSAQRRYESKPYVFYSNMNII